ncbi:zinc finger protein [Trichoderma cornu-damae]|uniref:Zinc finger protein n=1 Tax=Trichoderma cornu-damae TaxID=654480 RepID=A0A9P8QQJ4_9HYPO|nr:zinc finger protein [Trichoderma cornu-damae]
MASKPAPLIAPLLRRPFVPPSRLPPFAFRRSRPISNPPALILSSICQRRLAHAIPRPPRRQLQQGEPATKDAPSSEGDRPEPKGPAFYQLSFTCVPCGHRSHHNVSKQGYHHGSTLITCPSCRNRHVISDHLNIFGDRKITVEDLMREKGQLVKRGSLGEDGDIEFWPEEAVPEKVALYEYGKVMYAASKIILQNTPIRNGI